MTQRKQKAALLGRMFDLIHAGWRDYRVPAAIEWRGLRHTYNLSFGTPEGLTSWDGLPAGQAHRSFVVKFSEALALVDRLQAEKERDLERAELATRQDLLWLIEAIDKVYLAVSAPRMGAGLEADQALAVASRIDSERGLCHFETRSETNKKQTRNKHNPAKKGGL